MTTEIVVRRFQPPKNLPAVIFETKLLIKEETITNPFLPDIQEDFFIYNVDELLKKIDRNLYDKKQPRLRDLETGRIAEMLAEKVVDKLYSLQDAALLEKNNMETMKGKLEIGQIKVSVPTEVVRSESTERIVQRKKDTKKWSLRRFVDVLLSCFKKNKDDN